MRWAIGVETLTSNGARYVRSRACEYVENREIGGQKARALINKYVGDALSLISSFFILSTALMFCDAFLPTIWFPRYTVFLHNDGLCYIPDCIENRSCNSAKPHASFLRLHPRNYHRVRRTCVYCSVGPEYLDSTALCSHLLPKNTAVVTDFLTSSGGNS